ncbi:retropepsin-like aspartic protease [Zymomonas mobilis]|uniref:retropepsin-like aspartic protease n=1 Tax=Zymomonas mobilis TaxID=542 RepID=UPI0021C48E66|nr:retropepsin-like aspartic protease [Zymomonas mobilis]MCP9306983.1 retropepsin-like domain-containing protein [Zymomonas mobilis]
MFKKYRSLLYPLLLNSVLLPPLKADKPLVSPKLVEILKQYSPQDLRNGIEFRPGDEEMQRGVLEGDDLLIDKAANALKGNNLVSQYAEIDKFRVKGDYQNANKLLDICGKTFFQKPDDPDPLPPISGIGIVCKQILAGNYFLDGNLKDWGKSLDFVKNVYYPPIRKISGLEQFSLSGTKMGSLSVLPDSIPSFIVTGIDHQQNIPLQYQIPIHEDHRRESDQIPHVTVFLNGKEVPFFLEIGAAIGKLPKAWSHSPHVHIIGHLERVTNAASEFFSGDLGIVDELKIGKAVLKNVPFLFTDVSQAYLGLMILQKLGKVRIDKQQMTFGKDINCNCQQDIHLGSALGGDFQTLKYPITWQGKTNLVAVDLTQNNSLFTLWTFKPDFTEEEQETTFQFPTKENHKTVLLQGRIVKSDLSIDGINYGARKEFIIKDTIRNPATVMGLFILNKVTLYLDFINHKACLMPNNSDATPMPQ